MWYVRSVTARQPTRSWTYSAITRKLAAQQTAVAKGLPTPNHEALVQTCQKLLSLPVTFTPLELLAPRRLLDAVAVIVEHRSGTRIAVQVPGPLWHAALGEMLGPAPRTNVPVEAERGALLYLAAQLTRAGLGQDFFAAGVTTTDETLCAALGLSQCSEARWCAQSTVLLGETSAALTLLCDAPILPATKTSGPNISAIPIPCMLSCGEANLRTSELRTLGNGVVVLLDRFSIKMTPSGLQGTARLTPIEDAAVFWECVMHGGQLTLGRMQQDTPEAPTSANLRDLPVRLQVELARLSLTLGELESLQVGQVLRLAKSVGDRVTLSANGQPIALGEVVDVDGELGVRIVRLETGDGA